jgi:SpoIID/LytB domain protein
VPALGVRAIRLFVALVTIAVAGCFGAAAHAAPPLFLISGGGFGHGVGMSQYGTEGFALHGYTYRHILAHYYPGTRLSRVGNTNVRVLLLSGRGRVTIASTSRFRVTGGRGHTFALPAGAQGVDSWFSVRVGRRRRLLRLPLRFAPGRSPLTVNGAAYRGSLTVSKGLTVVNTLPIESYLRGVVPAEMPSHWLRQALAVQAVAARSYALSSLHPGASFDVYPDMRSQMYLGIGTEQPSTDAAVAQTAGQVLTWHGRVARTYFSSSSGGRTAANEDAWPGMPPVPYLRSVTDPYDTISPYHRWRPLVLPASRLAAKLGLGAVDDVEVTSARSGWAETVHVHVPGHVRTLPAGAFAGRLGLRSQSFRVGVLQLEAPAGATVYGRGIVLRALARGVDATLQVRRPGDAWHSARLAPRARLVVHPLRTTEYRLASDGVATGAVRVDVAPALVVRRERRALSGRVEPAIAGLHITVQRLLRGDWLTIRSARVRSGGAFRLQRGLPSGTYRVKTASTPSLRAGASPPIRVP